MMFQKLLKIAQNEYAQNSDISENRKIQKKFQSNRSYIVKLNDNQLNVWVPQYSVLGSILYSFNVKSIKIAGNQNNK